MRLPRRLPPHRGEVARAPARPKGARVYLVLCALAVPLGLGFLAAGLALPSPIHESVGLAERVEATVVDREWRARTRGVGGGRYGGSGSCERYRYTVEWEDRTAWFNACVTSDLGVLEVGEPVELLTVAWTDEVDAEPDYFWPIAFLLVGALWSWWALRGTRRYWRLASGRARGPRFEGSVAEVAEGSVLVRLAAPTAEDATQDAAGDPAERTYLRLLLSMKRSPFARGQRVVVISSGVTMLSKRPHGPWAVVVQPGTDLRFCCTHAWVSEPRPERAHSRPKRR